MSWLNLNQSLNSLKGQITNFASEVLSESVVQESEDGGAGKGPGVEDLQEICRSQELEIESLKKSIEELQTSLQAERLSGKNGVRDEESSWYWDPSPQTSQSNEKENMYKDQIQRLQKEVSFLKETELGELKSDNEIELERLREENRSLMNNLEDLDSQHQLAMERLLTLKSELQNNFEVLKQDHLELKSSNERYESEVKILSEKLKDRDRDGEVMATIKADHETLQNKYQNLERIHSLLRENAEKFQEENQELHEEVFKLQEQVTKLEHDLEMAIKSKALSNTVPKENYEELLQQLNDLKHRRTVDHDQLDAINIDDNAKSVIETLKRDINDLKDKLTSREAIQEQFEHKTVKSEKIMFLYNKYVNFELPVDYVGEMPASDDGVILYKLESVFKTVNSFKKEIDLLEHKLSEKSLNISHLQTQIDDITTENDFLTTDLQHLERELNEMKKNNDFLISEIAALKNTSKLEPIIETHEDNIVKLESELADSNRINKTFESKIKSIETELMNVTSEKVNMQNSLYDLKEKYSLILNEFEEYKNQTKAVEELEQNVNLETTKNLKKAVDEIDELKKKLNAANAKNEQLAIDIHIIDNDKVLLTKEVDELKQYLEKKSSEHNELEVLKFSLEQKLQDIENTLDQTIRRKNEIEIDRSNLVEQISLLEKRLASKESENLLQNNLDSLHTENSEITMKLNETLKENCVLNEKIKSMTIESENLKLENDSLKTNNTNLQENIASLQISMKNFSDKHNENEILNEIATLKDDNHSLLEKKLQLETELVSTDGKIVHLEQEFEKILSQLNEKDNIIETLNSTVVQKDVTLADLNKNVTELENILIIKNNELERFNLSIEELNERLNTTSQNLIEVQEEMNRVSNEKEIINKQITIINEELITKDEEILKLQTNIQELEKNNIECKTIMDSKDKEIKELNQSIVELTDKIITTDNTSHHNDEYAKLVQEKEASENEVIDLKSKLTANEQDLIKLKLTLESYEKSSSEYQAALNNSNTEKAELINLVNLKHNESIQYHNEIQRLNHVLLEQTNEIKKLANEKDCLVQNQSMNCSHCESLQITLKEKDEIIIALNQNMTEYDRMKAELFNATKSVQNLTDKCENLNKNLGIQIETVKKLTAENVQLSEQEQNLTRELERLRAHLMEKEESYTQELMASEQKLTECQTRLYQVEERAKQTSTVYTSNNIRANQEVETLRNQIKLLEKQREEVQSRLSEAEDARSRSEAALINLQVVLEQFQLDKERDVQVSTEKIRNQMEELKRQNNGLKEDITRLNSKLEEALAGLQAASRLGDQVETKTAQINDLKEQVRTLQTAVAAAEERYYNTISNQQDKVDKNLVKNLVINYVVNSTQNAANKTQVLRVLSTVLDFNQKECERLGLVRAPAGDSLAVEFVRFLQHESRPRAPPPGMMPVADTSRSTTPVSRKNSTLGPNPVFEPGHKRNPSTGSNNLLFQNIDNIETTSQRSGDSEREPRVFPITQLPMGVNQTRNTEGAILKHVLNDTEYK